MTKSFSLLLCLFLAPGASFAKPNAPKTKAAPLIEVDPAARRLLAQARAKYASLRGLSFDLKSIANGKAQPLASVSFQAPISLLLSQTQGDKRQTVIMQGRQIFVDRGATYSDLSLVAEEGSPQVPVPKSTVLALISNLGVAGAANVVTDWLDNHDSLNEKQMAEAARKNHFHVRVSLVAPTVVEGVRLRGVKTQTLLADPKSEFQSEEQILWFDTEAPILRRVETRITLRHEKSPVLVDVLANERLNPSFPASTFSFSPGTKTPVSDTTPFFYDPRLIEGTAPYDFSAKTLSAAPISPANFKGKVLILDFWATWCGPCVASLPELQSVYNKYHAKGLEVVGISLDQDQTQLESFVRARKMPWPQVFDGHVFDSPIPRQYGVAAIPFFLVIGRDGKIASVNPREDLEGAVKRALAR